MNISCGTIIQIALLVPFNIFIIYYFLISFSEKEGKKAEIIQQLERSTKRCNNNLILMI